MKKPFSWENVSSKLIILAVLAICGSVLLGVTSIGIQHKRSNVTSASERKQWHEIVSGPHYEAGATFFIAKGSDGRPGYVVFCSKEDARVYLGMPNPNMVSVRVVQPEGALISNSFLVATGFKEIRENKK